MRYSRHPTGGIGHPRRAAIRGVHLASPFVLGASGATAAARLGLPSVAIFQADVAGFARRYDSRGADPVIWSWLRRVHGMATLTPAPSIPTLRELQRRTIPRVVRGWSAGAGGST